MQDATDEDRAGVPPGVATQPSAASALTRHERRLRFWLRFWAASFAMEIALYLWWAWSEPASRAFAVNSVAKDLTFLVLAVLVIADVRRFGRLMTVLVLGHLAIALCLAALLITGATAVSFPATPASVLGIGPLELPSDWRVPVWLAAALFATAHLGWLHITARRARYGLRYLWPTHFDTLVALAETVITDPRVPPAKIATALDRYWAGFNGDKSRARLAPFALYALPLLFGRAPFPLMDAEGRRDFIERHFIADGLMSLPRIVRAAIRAAIRFAVQMVYMGYYGHAETYEDTGYVPFSERKDVEVPPKKHCALKTLHPDRVGALQADVVIVGSGAAGGVLAHYLADQGHDVLMIERGDFVDPATFSENELEMYSRLYSDGAVQLSRDFGFQVLQGRCVGGGTVVNNAVCFRLPPEVLAGWNESGAGLPDTLDGSFGAVETLMRVARQDFTPKSSGVAKVVKAIRELRLDRTPYESDVVLANINAAKIDGCAGCGYCNMGCAYGKKLSMLDLVLPNAQHCADRRRQQDPSYKGRLRILPTCEVTSIERQGGMPGSGSHRVSGVLCRVGADRRELRVKAGTVVVAAGAIHSSQLLQRSRIGGSRVGRGLCANVASFMTGDFEQELRAYEGLQIAHYVDPPRQSGYVIETWFDPVVVTALSMPGWLEDHQFNMARYAHLMCVGVLVGTDPRSSNRVRRRSFSFRPSEAELSRLAQALKEAGEVLFAAGATRVMPSTFDYREFERKEQLDDLEGMLKQRGNPSLQTSHPQGGNAIGVDASEGAVDPTFRVHGYDNLYVCDASVFPTAVTVNPQLTVMALAHHAATHPGGLGALAP